MAWVGSLADRFEREVVALDGKTVRRSFDHGREQSALHVVSAWAGEQGLVPGHSRKLAGTRAFAAAFVSARLPRRPWHAGATTCWRWKATTPLAHAAVVEHFDQRCFRVGAPHRANCDAFDDTYGPLVRRRVFASTDAAALEALSGWPGLRTVLAVGSIRSVNRAPKVESEIRYLLSSCPDAPAVPRELEGFAAGPGDPLALEGRNALHRVLDVTFREGDSRVRDRTAARNLALLRKITFNIVGRDAASKASVRTRREKAAWNDAYMLKPLAG